MNDWLDLALKNPGAVDDGFADRVVSVGKARDRTALMLRALAAVLVVGFVVSLAAGVVLHGAERVGAGLIGDPGPRMDAERANFTADFQRLDALPFFARRDGDKDAGAVLNPPTEEDRADDPRCAAEHGKKNVRFEDSTCDTSFLVGLAAYDRWTGPQGRSWWLGSYARSHLRRAGLVSGAAFAAAARDVEHLGRLALVSRASADKYFLIVNEEMTLVRERGGDTGGFVPVVDAKDAVRLRELWQQASHFAGAAANDDDIALIVNARSVLSCGAVSDATGSLAVQAHFAGDHIVERTRPLMSIKGCGPRDVVNLTQVFCDTPDSISCAFYVRTLQLPPFRQAMAAATARLPEAW